MQQANEHIFIAGLISPEVLLSAENNPSGAQAMAMNRCSVLEIRYDLFKNIDEWESLSQRVSNLCPKALRLGTIRLKRDGGEFENEMAERRMALLAGKALDWIDIERGIDFSQANGLKGFYAKVIRSWHLFDRTPGERELNEFAEECIRLKTSGCKVAAMAHSKSDAEPLYDFAKKYGKSFELFAAFAMGEEGKESRLRSLKEGANLIYGSIGRALAPGQLSIAEIFSTL